MSVKTTHKDDRIRLYGIRYPRLEFLHHAWASGRGVLFALYKVIQPWLAPITWRNPFPPSSPCRNSCLSVVWSKVGRKVLERMSYILSFP